MELLINDAVKKFFYNRMDLFGEGSEFLSFRAKKQITATDGDNSHTIFGQVGYRTITCDKIFLDSLCLKLMPRVVTFDSSNTYGFMNEMFFYTKMLPFLKSFDVSSDLFAEFYEGRLEMGKDVEAAILIMENLQERGYESCAKKTFLDFAHLSLMVRKLGEFHALSYKAKCADPNAFNSLALAFSPNVVTVGNDMQFITKKNAERVLDILQNDPEYSKRLSGFQKVTERSTFYFNELLKASANSPFSVISHFSFTRNNILFRYENGVPVDMKLFDMAFCTLASPSTDLAVLLYLSTDQPMRDEHWDDLVEEYYKSFCANCPPDLVPPKNRLLQQPSDLGWIFGCIMALNYLPLAIAKEKLTLSDRNRIMQEISKHSLQNDSKKPFLKIIEKVGEVFGTNEIVNIIKDAIDRGLIDY